MLTDAELQDILWYIEHRQYCSRDTRRLRAHITEQAQTIASLRAEVDARKQQTQAPAGWHKLFLTTPTQGVSISVNGVPVALHNGDGEAA